MPSVNCKTIQHHKSIRCHYQRRGVCKSNHAKDFKLYVCLFVCVHTFTQVHLLMHVNTEARHWLRVSSFKLSTLFSETKSLTESEVNHFLIDWQARESQRPLSQKPLINAPPLLAFYMGSRNLNSGPHACTMNTLY